jgi:hypothetical protein
MNGASVSHEVGASPGIGGEEFVRKVVAFQAITVRAREDDIAGMVRAPMSEWIDVIKRCRFEVEPGPAVHAAASAVAHGRALDRSLVPGTAELTDRGALGTAG